MGGGATDTASVSTAPKGDAPKPRVIPGLAPKVAPPSSARRKKHGRGASSAVVQDPIQTALTEEAPTPSKLPEEFLTADKEDGTGAEKGKTIAGLGLALPGLVGAGNGKDKDGQGNGTDAGGEGTQGKKVNASEVVNKKLKATKKKLQRVEGYEKLDKLNEDQKRSLANKPVLEELIKELEDLQKILQADEAAERSGIESAQAAAEAKTAARIEKAVNDAQSKWESDLTLLLQFFRLQALFNPQSGFAPSGEVPPVVANATGQEAAAVYSVYNNLVNGPMFGGGDDAISSIRHLVTGAEVEVGEAGVPYSRVKQMIIDLTAPPAELAHATHPTEDDVIETNGHAEPAIAQASASASAGLADINFMQASELEAVSSAGLAGVLGVAAFTLPEETTAPPAAAPEAPIATAAATATASTALGLDTTSATPAAPESKPAHAHGSSTPGWDAMVESTPTAGKGSWADDGPTTWDQIAADTSKPISSWAAEVGGGEELGDPNAHAPPPESTVAATESAPTPAADAAPTKAPEDDGFQEARPRGSRGREHDFSGGAERGGYGGHRGYPRGGRGAGGERRVSDGPGGWRTMSGGGGGMDRGGGGRGRGGGERGGRGGGFGGPPRGGRGGYERRGGPMGGQGGQEWRGGRGRPGPPPSMNGPPTAA